MKKLMESLESNIIQQVDRIIISVWGQEFYYNKQWIDQMKVKHIFTRKLI